MTSLACVLVLSSIVIIFIYLKIVYFSRVTNKIVSSPSVISFSSVVFSVVVVVTGVFARSDGGGRYNVAETHTWSIPAPVIYLYYSILRNSASHALPNVKILLVEWRD